MPAPRSIAESDWCAAKVHVACTLMTLARTPGLKESERIISYGDLDLSIQTALHGVRGSQGTSPSRARRSCWGR